MKVLETLTADAAVLKDSNHYSPPSNVLLLCLGLDMKLEKAEYDSKIHIAWSELPRIPATLKWMK